ncbi:MAG TPA: NrfD/PsrC family molybdoenzyme membrane anchor subunit [Trebonia sp.]|nr:NrfD/PsrC family molybdoenzyme membrane anchor subunit [Trebonia sp.]
MNISPVTRQGLKDVRPGREALPGAKRPSRSRPPGQGRQPRATPGGELRPNSYYGLPVLNKPVWEPREIAGYFFLGGLAGASSLVALGAELTGRPQLARGAKLGAAGAISLSMVALVKDLGRPARFLNMMRVFKPTSPMSVGTWIVSAYAPAALAAAACDVTGRFPAAGRIAAGGAALLGPGVASYTAVLLSNTAVPAWHEARAVMPFLFVSSAASAAAGLGLITAAGQETGPVSRLAVAGAAGELVAGELMLRGMDPVVRRGYDHGRARVLLTASKAIAVAGAAGAVAGAVTGSRAIRVAAGVALLAASACTRFGVFHAGITSADDPEATVGPQRARLAARAGGSQPAAPAAHAPARQPASGPASPLKSTSWGDSTSIPGHRQSGTSIPLSRKRDGGESS